MKTRIEFTTMLETQNPVNALSYALLHKELSESAMLFAFAPNGEVSNGVFRTKSAAKAVFEEMNSLVSSGKTGFWIGFKIVKA